MDLVSSLTMYVDEMTSELEEMQNRTALPTRAPTTAYHKSLLSWYSDLGRGNRYVKAKIQAMY
eukprot:5324762-Ditylum_brightwellii.AAC.1